MAIPWLTFDAIREIKAHLPQCPVIFEFGSGHSTLYWAKLSASVISVEDDERWYQMLRSELTARGCSSVSIVLASSLDDYIGVIRQCPKESQDLVLVDGAYRRNCVEAAIPYVKPGGLLVVDNTDWHWFKDAPLEGIPPNWEKIAYRGFGPMLGHVSETTLWKKPR